MLSRFLIALTLSFDHLALGSAVVEKEVDRYLPVKTVQQNQGYGRNTKSTVLQSTKAFHFSLIYHHRLNKRDLPTRHRHSRHRLLVVELMR